MRTTEHVQLGKESFKTDNIINNCNFSNVVKSGSFFRMYFDHIIYSIRESKLNSFQLQYLMLCVKEKEKAVA